MLVDARVGRGDAVLAGALAVLGAAGAAGGAALLGAAAARDQQRVVRLLQVQLLQEGLAQA